MSRDLIPNSTQVPDVILDKWMPLLASAEVCVVMFIARKTYGWGKDFDRLSTSQLADGTGLGERTVVRALDSLEAVGAIQKAYPGDGKTSTAYRLRLGENDDVQSKLLARNASEKGCQNGRGAKTAGVPKRTNEGCQNGIHKETKREKQRRNPHAPKGGPVSPPHWPEGFEQFIGAYPIPGGKAPALKSWNARKLTPEQLAAALAHFEAIKPVKMEERGDAIAPSVYLNQSRYDDPVDIAFKGLFNTRKRARGSPSTESTPISRRITHPEEYAVEPLSALPPAPVTKRQTVNG